jgi:hypothetical protein
LPKLQAVTLDGIWRVHEEVDVVDPPRWPTGKWRFDAPDGSYPVTYGNLTEIGAFAEVYGDRRQIGPDQGSRHLSQVWSTEPLKLVALDDPRTLSGLGIDASISIAPEYRRTMEWGRRLREWYTDAHGISFLGRKAAAHTNYCLFLDRCDGKLEVDTLGQLIDLRARVMRACASLNIVPRLFDPKAGGGWPGSA